jgi:hypothetical protein
MDQYQPLEGRIPLHAGKPGEAVTDGRLGTSDADVEDYCDPTIISPNRSNASSLSPSSHIALLKSKYCETSRGTDRRQILITRCGRPDRFHHVPRLLMKITDCSYIVRKVEVEFLSIRGCSVQGCVKGELVPNSVGCGQRTEVKCRPLFQMPP